MFASNSYIIIQGYISISKNSNGSTIGGGIFFSDFSIMVLRPNTNVIIAENNASTMGVEYSYRTTITW